MAEPVVLRLDTSPPRQEWCDGCMTSSRVVFSVNHLTASGVSCATFDRCVRCNPLTEEEEEF